MPSRRRDEAAARFEADCVRIFSEAAQEAVTAGIASLEEGRDGGRSYLRLTPQQSSACQIKLYADIAEDGGVPNVVVRYMAGGSLEDRLARAPNRRLDVDDTMRLAAEIAAGSLTRTPAV